MSLQSDLKKFAQLTGKAMEQVVKESLIDTSTRIVLASPVDTGAFRGNWLSATGSADTRYNTQDTTEKLGEMRATINGIALGEVFYFTNSLPYAERLENGWSQQAPAGVVKLAVAQWQQTVRRKIRQL